jgi:rod shape-determining protein MreD
MIARLGMMGLVLVTALLLNTVVFPAFAIAGWRPELITLTVVAFALADGPGTGARYGFLAGLAADLLSDSGQLVGITALVLLGVGYVSGLARPYFAGTTLAGQVAITGAASAGAVLAHGILALLLDFSAFTPGTLLQAAAVVGCYTAALAPVVLRPLMALSRRVPATPGAGSTMTVRSYGPDR